MANRALDSFTIRIPFEKCYNYDTRLTSRVIEIYEDLDGLIRNESDLSDPSKSCLKPIVCDGQGNDIAFKVSLVSLFGVPTLFVVVTSKMLKKLYFQGITNNTAIYAYNYIMSRGYFQCSFDDFLDSPIFDIDIKTDYHFDQWNYEETLKERKRLIKGAKLFKDKDTGKITGLSYSKRKVDNPSINEPFVKTYSKFDEFTTKSKLFRSIYFPNWFDDTLRRTEVTIANSKFVDSLLKKEILPFKPKSLRDWLSLDDDVLKAIIVNFVDRWENPYNFIKAREKLLDEKMSSTDYAIMKMYELLKKEDYTVQDMANLLDSYPTSSDVLSSQKSRFKAKIKKFDLLLSKTTDQMKNLGVYSLY